MKVAYFSPWPPERTGVADYSALLLPALSERIAVEVVRRGAKRWPRGADEALYHVGNNVDAHGWVVEALRRRPGVVVLHDFVLHHLVAGLTLGHGDGVGYLEAMQRESGPIGRLLAHGVIDGLIPPLWETRADEFPLTSGVLDHATGLIVHSKYVEARVRALGFDRPIWRIPHPAWPVDEVAPAADLPEGRVPVIGSLGNLNASKRVPQLLQAFARLRASFPDALLVLVGSVAPQVELDAWLERLVLRRGEEVLVPGYVEESRLRGLIARCDVCVSLRFPTMGETSGTAIRALSAGRPLVVSDVGWFSELPDSAAAKVPIDGLEVDLLTAIFERLAADPKLAARMGAASIEYVREHHGLDAVADAYVAAIEESAGRDAVARAVLGDVAAAAAGIGVEPDDALLSDVAARIGEVDVVR